MRLLFIFTGGTIGSTVSGDYISTDKNKPYKLIEAYRKRYSLEHAYDVAVPYTELSEQNTGVTISKLIACVKGAVDRENDNKALEEKVRGNETEAVKASDVKAGDIQYDRMHENGAAHGKYDGIIVTHGTDTLPYSAAALSYALGNNCIPVCLVSSNYPIEDERANGVDNLHGAIRLIEAAYSETVGEYDGDEISEDGVKAQELKDTEASEDGVKAQELKDTEASEGGGMAQKMKNAEISEGGGKAQELKDTEISEDGEESREIKCVHKGVFVIYRNHDGAAYIHRASRLLETQPFSDEYYSVRNEFYGKIVNDSFQKNPAYKEKKDELRPLGAVRLTDVCPWILRYHLYPGIRLEVDTEYDKLKGMQAGGRRCILLEGFHSGTMNTKLPEYQEYFEKMNENKVPVLLTGMRRGISYESTSLYEGLHIKPVYDIAPVAAYMKLWLLMAAGREWSADIMNRSLGGDV